MAGTSRMGQANQAQQRHPGRVLQSAAVERPLWQPGCDVVARRFVAGDPRVSRVARLVSPLSVDQP